MQAYGVCGSSSLGPSEVEGEPGVVLSLAQLPGVELSLVHTLRSGLPTEGRLTHRVCVCVCVCVCVWRGGGGRGRSLMAQLFSQWMAAKHTVGRGGGGKGVARCGTAARGGAVIGTPTAQRTANRRWVRQGTRGAVRAGWGGGCGTEGD